MHAYIYMHTCSKHAQAQHTRTHRAGLDDDENYQLACPAWDMHTEFYRICLHTYMLKAGASTRICARM